jgi:hypothetical protein
VSINPGTTKLPRASIVSIPAGTATLPRGPALSIFPSRTMITASLTGGRPVPSSSVPPTTARGGAGTPGAFANAVVMAIFQPSGVSRNSRSEMPACSVAP